MVSKFSGLSCKLIFVASVVSFGTWLPMGYMMTSINTTQFLILKWIRHVVCTRRFPVVNESMTFNLSLNVSDYSEETLWCSVIPNRQLPTILKDNGELATLWALVGAAIPTGGAIGAWFAGWFQHRFGNRYSLLLSNVISVVGTLISSLCTIGDSFEMLVIGRFILGVFAGQCGFVVPVYLAEISPIPLRGAVSMFALMSRAVGMLLGVFFGIPVIFGTEELWIDVLWVRLIPSIALFLVLPFCPESPRHLITLKNGQERALRALKWLRNSEDVAKELEEIEADRDKMAGQRSLSLKEVLTNRILLWALAICNAAMVTQHLSGYTAVFTYSTSILAAGGLPKAFAVYGTIGLMGIPLFIMVLSMLLVDRLGRRTLFLFGAGGCLLCNIGMVIFLNLSKSACGGCQYAALACFVVFMIFFNIGTGSVPWIWSAELFPRNARTSALSVTWTCNYSLSLAVVFLFPIVHAAIEEWIFAISAGSMLAITVFIYFTAVETKGKTFQEVQAELQLKFGKADQNIMEPPTTVKKIDEEPTLPAA
ncbi:solute carrier family 2, facilitated glucose transporter member 3-like [Paramacrobiotus metropolitanus]|uniref:solute carrier family 2, facilitated glucose transporter member 3-like n=1 Tax=Paramacrobiotus metropolitanus TaxID=2943436 RepID=UPI0024461B2B|nr:solute carrier family 2, facilitated glucose transporter member 3-like [Paramacrobiotus metropolitanus]